MRPGSTSGSSFAANILVTAGFFALCILDSAKGVTATFHVDELYFWVTTYAHGFVRRGVIGSLEAPWLAPVTSGGVHVVAASWWLIGLACSILLGVAFVWRGLASGSLGATAAIAALVATSPMLGLIAFHVGYPDTLIVALVVLATVLLLSAPALALAVTMVLLAAIHEMILLLLLPIVVFATCMRPCTRARAAVIGAGGLTAFVLPLLSNRPSTDTVSRLVAAGLPLADAQDQLDTSLHQTIAGSASTMVHFWSGHTLNGVLGILYAGLPGIMIMLVGMPAASAWISARVRAGAGRAWLLAAYAGACLGPIALLALAWDLSRIASFTTLTSAMTVTIVWRNRKPTASRPLISASCVMAVCYLCMPIANLYFTYGRVLNTVTIAQACAPCAKAGTAAIDFFNRGLTPAARAAIDNDAQYGNANLRNPKGI